MDEDDFKRALAKIDKAVRFQAASMFFYRAMMFYGVGGTLIQLLNAWAWDQWVFYCPAVFGFFGLTVWNWFSLVKHRDRWSKLLRFRYDFIRLGRASTPSEAECFEQQCLAAIRDL
jgi:hypothetical protein